MGELSKFKVITMLFLCMFVLFVGVIYTNTREIVDNQENETKTDNAEAINKKAENIVNRENANNDAISNLYSRIEDLQGRVSELENGGNLKCKVEGIVTEKGFEQMNAENAVTTARNDGSDIVITCSF